MTFIAYASTVITDDNNSLLLVREKKEINYNKLNLPGGHMEPGESPMECAIREALEETDVNIELTGFIGVYLGRNKPSFHYIFTGKIKNGIPKANPEEILSVEWYTIDELMTMPKDAFVYREKLQDILEKYTSGKVTPIDRVIFDLKKI